MNSALNTPNSWPTTTAKQREAIRRRAEEIYIRDGKVLGHDLENWAQAEQEIRREFGSPSVRKAIVIRVDGEEFIGEYYPESCDGYAPGEFGPGSSVPVRFDGDKMLVLRPNGKVLQTIMVTPIG